MDHTQKKSAQTSATEGDPLRRAREEIMNGNYPAAAYFITNTLSPQSAANKRLNETQRIRLQLLRADAYSALGSHEKALADAMMVAENHPECVQALFVCGREHLKLFQIPESVRFFERAEELMKEGLPQEHQSVRDALAFVGIREEDLAPDASKPELRKRVPIVPTYEWIAEYEIWTRYAREARCLFEMTKSQVIDHAIAPVAIQLLLGKVAASANRATVVTVKNATPFVLHRERHSFTEGEFCDKTSFPQSIAPGQVAVTAVRSNSWRTGSKGLVQYKISGTNLSVTCSFENPLMGTFKSSAFFLGTGASSKQPSAAKAGVIFLKALALLPTNVQSFVVAEARPQVLRPLELARVLEFLPPYYVKRAACVSRSLRNAVSHLPPKVFAYAGKRVFPDYCLLSDFTQNNFTVHDKEEVRWQMVKEFSLGQAEISVIDALDHRVFVVMGDFEARTMELELHFGSRRCHISSLAENWVPLSRSAFLKTASGRQFGSITMTAAFQITFFADLKPTVPLLSVKRISGDPKSGSETAIISLEPSGVQWATLLLAPRSTKRVSTIAEITLHPGCDAHLCSLLCVYLWARLF
jgi:hypothetical protein